MTLTFQKKTITKFIQTFFTLVTLFFLFPLFSHAQGLSLSVSPTLFEMSASPSQAWKSSIKVINTNPQPLTVYATVVNFKPQGETGQGTFLPVFEEKTEGKTLAEWITVSDEPFVIPKESSIEIPIQVNVPEDASPGGHYAAIMIGTRPQNPKGKQQVSTAQMVTSLFFVRIAGDVIEKGVLRSFRASQSFVQTPDVDFEVRFENKGNVHLQPQGEIVITNMWGKERGIVPINQQTNFGNVLPKSIRKFNFSWKGESSVFDIGRYKAQLTLGFGQEEKQFVTSSASFWVIPVKPLVITLLILIAFIYFVMWSIKAYIRRMLALSGHQEYVPASIRRAQKNDVVIPPEVSIQAPVKAGLLDLKNTYSKAQASVEKIHILLQFVMRYKIFFIALLLFIVFVTIFGIYITNVTTEKRDYEITIQRQDDNLTLSSEEVIYNKENPEKTPSSQAVLATTTQNFSITLINSSDTPGVAAAMQKQLEKEDYKIEKLESDFETPKEKTVIVYDTRVQEAALALSKLLGGVLLSAKPQNDDSIPPEITIFIGNDYSAL